MYFYIENLSSTAVKECLEPWANPPPPIPDSVNTKEEYSKWCKDLATKSMFLSSYEGISKFARVSWEEDNKPFAMHGFIVDYDANVSDEAFQACLTHPQSEWLPAYGVRTFSGGGRLIWQFERPILLHSKEQVREFLKTLQRKLVLQKWLPGYDAPATGRANQYYHYGRSWLPLNPGFRIPASHLELWLYEAGQNVVLDDRPVYNIPMQALAQEVEKNYPSRWKGPFDLGARGVRFWDPSADNETAAIVRKDGMQCFTGNEAFVPWRKIFSNEFVERFEADKLAAVKSRVAWDGRAFWLQEADKWTDMSRDDFSQWLKVAGFDSAKPKGATCSEVDRIEVDLKTKNRVVRALPFLHHKPGFIYHAGQPYLNISRVKCVQPAPPGPEGDKARDAFPFIWNFMKTAFTDNAGRDEHDQLNNLLAWMKHFYCNALEGTPQPGQAVVLCGPPGKGKTFFSRCILSPMVGGWADASAFLVENSQWTDTVIEMPVMAIDDSIMTSDPRAITRFSNTIKKVVANANVTYNAKFQKSGDVPWFGRIVVTANTDAESLRILPDMDINLRDKVSLFKTSDHKIEFPADWQVTGKLVEQELPFFARWLLDWPTPEKLKASEKRFGVVSFQHPELYGEALQHGSAGIILEVLMRYLTESQKLSETDKEFWVGSVTQLYSELTAHNDAAMRGMKIHALSIALGHLSKRGYNVQHVRDPQTRMFLWKIGYDLSPAQEHDEQQEATTEKE